MIDFDRLEKEKVLLMPNTAIKVSNLTKVYHLYDHPQDRLKEALNPFKKSYHHDFHALNDVSFEIKKGETVGIIGKNGAGKSTLLKMITGVLTPTSGSIEVNGKISSLLELGAGFNPDMTGLENIYLQGTLTGYTHEEIDAKVDDILAFADIGEFIHQPVKSYSSGMYARLAFAVAINVDPDILIVDEVLSVGDARFQSKSIKKMEAIRNGGTTILFVSHATEQIKRFCTKAIWLENSTVKLIGDPAVVSDKYLDYISVKESGSQSNEQICQTSGRLAKIQSFSLDKSTISTFDSLEITIEYEVLDDHLDDLLVGVAIFDNERNYIFGPNTYLDKYIIKTTIGIHVLKYILPKISLLSGTYLLDVGIFVDKGIVNLDYINNVASLTIENKYFTEGRYFLEHEWR
jgi:teichoic acid transport system ATP-binding protein